VFGDVDIDKTVPQVVRAAFTNNGQVCLCGSRLFVHESIYSAFLTKFCAAVRALRCGAPLDPGTDVGPLSNASHYAKVLGCIELAKREGGTIECGGEWPPEVTDPALRGGYYVAPTVVSGLSWSARVAQEEIFGPVVTIHPFKDEDEVVGAANSVEYGLAGSVWTQNLTTAHRVCRRIDSGILWVNCWLHRDLRTPFGGTKASGIGREGGKFSLDTYSEWKNVCVYVGPP
jgi:aminomuconate-semialdehyde/2-hydroxymuconate-6-semialdehyde dehydrogenase